MQDLISIRTALTLTRFGCGVMMVTLLLGGIHPALAEQAVRRSLSGAMINTTQAAAPNVTALAKPPNKPTDATALQSTVRWKVPDQTDGRIIQQWLVRACPKVDGNPSAACQQVAALDGPNGQSSGAYVQAQIPSHVMFKGADTPVNAAEICAKNAAGISCANRIALAFAVLNSVPVPVATQGAAGGSPTGMPSGAFGARPAPGFGSALPTRGMPSGGLGASKTANSGVTRTGAPGGAVEVKPTIIATAKPPEPIVLTTNALRLKTAAPPPVQDIRVDTDLLRLKVASAVAPSDIVVSAMPLHLSVKQGLARVSVVGALKKNAIAVDATPLRIKVTAEPPARPIVVDTSPLTLKADMISPPAPISVSTATLKLMVTKPRQDIP